MARVAGGVRRGCTRANVRRGEEASSFPRPPSEELGEEGGGLLTELNRASFN